MPVVLMASITGITFFAKLSASIACALRPVAAASAASTGLPRAALRTFRSAKAALVLSEINHRSFPASAAWEVQHERVCIGWAFCAQVSWQQLKHTLTLK